MKTAFLNFVNSYQPLLTFALKSSEICEISLTLAELNSGHNKSLKFAPALRASAGRAKARRLAQTLAVCMRNSKLASSQPSSSGVLTQHGAIGSVESPRIRGNSKFGSCQLKVGSPLGQVPVESGRRTRRFVWSNASRVPGLASASPAAGLTPIGIPQLTMGSTGRGVTFRPASPGWFRGRAG